MSFSILSLPSPGVPVLVGMRELEAMQGILSCHTGRFLTNGRQTALNRTTKRHLVINFLNDIFPGSRVPEVQQHEQLNFIPYG